MKVNKFLPESSINKVWNKLNDLEENGSAKPVELTQAEWDALPDSKYTDGILYCITDSDNLTAKGLYYNGSENGLGNNVQDALDNVNEKVDEMNSKVEELVEEVGKSARLPYYYRKVTGDQSTSTTTIDISDIEGYQDLTIDDIVFFFATDCIWTSGGLKFYAQTTSYDNTTGIITIVGVPHNTGTTIKADARVMIKPDHIITATMKSLDATTGMASIDLTSFEDYQNITKDNINIQFTSYPVYLYNSGGGASCPKIDYDPTTGTLYFGMVNTPVFTVSSHESSLISGLGNIIVGIKY